MIEYLEKVDPEAVKAFIRFVGWVWTFSLITVVLLVLKRQATENCQQMTGLASLGAAIGLLMMKFGSNFGYVDAAFVLVFALLGIPGKARSRKFRRPLG